MKTMESAKKAYVAPRVTEVGVVVCDILSGSINSYDKNGNQEIKGEESLSNRNDTPWDNDGTWDDNNE